MSDETLPEVPELIPPAMENIAVLPYNVAMIIDGVVYQILNVDGASAAQYLAQPTFLQIGLNEARIGWTYDGTKFNSPVAPIVGE